MKMKTFEKLFMREEARDLYVHLQQLFENKKNKDVFFKTEMLRSVTTIGGTMAQGYETSLAWTEPYLREAKGYVGIVKNLAYIGEKLQYFTHEELEDITNRCSKIAAGLYKLMTSRTKKAE